MVRCGCYVSGHPHSWHTHLQSAPMRMHAYATGAIEAPTFQLAPTGPCLAMSVAELVVKYGDVAK
eukprot:7031882-Lingulodinium_polyedra.AAC.1